MVSQEEYLEELYGPGCPHPYRLAVLLGVDSVGVHCDRSMTFPHTLCAAFVTSKMHVLFAESAHTHYSCSRSVSA